MGSKVQSRVEILKLKVERDVARLGALNPYAVLDRGYALVESTDGKVLARKSQITEEVSEGRLIMSDGKVDIRFNK